MITDNTWYEKGLQENTNASIFVKHHRLISINILPMIGATKATPALFTRMSRPPNFLFNIWMHLTISSSFVTSHSIGKRDTETSTQVRIWQTEGYYKCVYVVNKYNCILSKCRLYWQCRKNYNDNKRVK